MIRCRPIVVALFAFSAISLRAQFFDDLAKIRIDAERGNPAAQAKYADACNGSFRYEEAVHWYQLAAEQGLASAQRELGRILQSGRSAFAGRSPQVPADPVLAVKWFTQAAAQRDTQAMTALGQCYEQGRGVRADPVQAFKWYSLAADKGDILAGIHRRQLVLKLTPDQLQEGDQLVKAARGGSDLVPSARLVGIELKGISGSKQRRLALINNETFAAGESSNIKVGNQPVLITCHQIEEDSVIISVGGATGMARLKLGGPAEPVPLPSQAADVRPNAATIQSPDNIPRHSVTPQIRPSEQMGGATKRESATPLSAMEAMAAHAVAAVKNFLMLVIILAGGLFVVAIVCWTIARRNKRDAESLRKLYGPRTAHASAGSAAGSKPDDLRNWFQQHSTPPLVPGSARPLDLHRVVAEPRQSVPVAAAISIDELIQLIRNLDWFQFEKIIGVIYRQLGYAVSRRGGANPDGGIDLVIAQKGKARRVGSRSRNSSNGSVERPLVPGS